MSKPKPMSKADAKARAEWAEAARGVADRAKLISDPTRVRILGMLREQGRLVNEMCDLLGMHQSAVSRHLSLLRLGNAIEAGREGAAIRYTLTPTGKRLLAVIDHLSG